MAHALVVFTLLVVVGEAGTEPHVTRSSRVVGSVYGRSITAADVGLTGSIDPTVQFDARDKTRWELMGRIKQVLGKPISDRFVKERKIDATEDEIAVFKLSMLEARDQRIREAEDRLAKIKLELAAANLPDEKRANLLKEQDTLARSVARRDDQVDDVPDAIARQFIVAWKTERELQRVYGGRVIFQQFGAEALDARRRLYEEAEKNGDLKFDDPGVRHMFYYYANMKHTAIDEEALEEPWFFRVGR